MLENLMSSLMHKRFSILGLVLFFLTASGFAQTLEDLFPNARQVYVSKEQTNNYRLALGSMLKSGGLWFPEREQVLSGELRRITLEMDGVQKSGILKVTEKIEKQLAKLNARRLFSCSAQDCGSSNAWANYVFQIKQLYGLNRHQYYSAWELVADTGAVNFLAVYVVKRGNRRVYLQIETLSSDRSVANTVATSPAAIISAVEEQGFVVLSGLSFNDDSVQLGDSQRQSWVEVFKRRPQWQWIIVGHDYGRGTLDKQRQRSLLYAEKMREIFIAHGVKAEILTAHGVGSLAPRGGAATSRVEIIAQSKQ